MYQAHTVVNTEWVDLFCEAYLALGALSVSVFEVGGSDVKRLSVLVESVEWFEAVGGFVKIEPVSKEQWEFAHELTVTFVSFLPGVWIYAEGVDVLPEHQKDLILTLDLRGAFGDGAHPTTVLCGEFLSELKRAGKLPETVVDIGTGTGVLAILASKWGVTHVDAFDYDVVSVARTRTNVELNDVTVSVMQADVLKAIPVRCYDCVIANLHSDLITQALPMLKRWMSPSGVMILSGISVKWKLEMEALFAANKLMVEDFRILDGWCGFVLRCK